MRARPPKKLDKKLSTEVGIKVNKTKYQLVMVDVATTYNIPLTATVAEAHQRLRTGYGVTDDIITTLITKAARITPIPERQILSTTDSSAADHTVRDLPPQIRLLLVSYTSGSLINPRDVNFV